MKIAIKVLVYVGLLVGIGLYRLDTLNKIPVKLENYTHLLNGNYTLADTDLF